jgi:hypothetical protein
VAKPNEHFGNPWSEGGYGGTIKTKSENGIPAVTVAANNYKEWLLGTKFQDVKPEQRAWILDQINQGKLDGATLLYSGKLMGRGQGSHVNSLVDVVNQMRGGESVEQEGPIEPLYKDKAQRVRVEYPTNIEGAAGNVMRSNDLIRMTNVSDETEIEIPEGVENEYDYLEGLYGWAVANLHGNYIEPSVEQAEFLRDNPEFADAFADSILEDEEAIDDNLNVTEYAQRLLDRNETLIDEAQMSLFTGFDDSREFTADQKATIITNFATMMKITRETAAKHINAMMAEDAQKTIDKLKECFL